MGGEGKPGNPLPRAGKEVLSWEGRHGAGRGGGTPHLGAWSRVQRALLSQAY